jgi:hypothetical protein
MCHCGVRFKFLVLSFKKRLVSWDNLLILGPQRHIHKRCSPFAQQSMKHSLTLFLLLPWWTSFAQVDSVDIWIDRIKNNQLHGTCHYSWTLEVDRSATNVFNLIKNGKSARTRLIDKLTDKDRGVICHFILSTLSDTLTIETLEMNEAKIRYRVNGLEFEEINGRIYATADDLRKIKILWRRRNE